MVETVGGLKIDLDLDAKDLEASIKTIDREVSKLDQSLDKVGGEGFEKLEQSAKEAKQAVSDTGTAAKKAGDEVASAANKANASWDNAKRGISGFKEGLAGLASSASMAAVGLATIPGLMSDTQKQAVGASVAALALGQSLFSAGKAITDIRSGWQAFTTMLSTSSILATVTNPLVLGLTAVAAAFALIELKTGAVSKVANAAFSVMSRYIDQVAANANAAAKAVDKFFSAFSGGVSANAEQQVKRVVDLYRAFANLPIPGFNAWGMAADTLEELAKSESGALSPTEALAAAFERQKEAISEVQSLYDSIGSSIDNLVGAQETQATVGADLAQARDQEITTAEKYSNTYDKTSRSVRDLFDEMQRGSISGTQAADAVRKLGTAAQAEWAELLNVYKAWIQASEARRRYEVESQTAAANTSAANDQMAEAAANVGVSWDGSAGKLGAVIDKMNGLLDVIKQIKAQTPITIDVNVNQNGALQTGSYYPGQVVTNPATGQSITVSRPFIQPSATTGTTQYLTQSKPPDAGGPVSSTYSPSSNLAVVNTGTSSNPIPTVIDTSSPFSPGYQASSNLGIGITSSSIWKSSEIVGKKAAESMNKAINGTQSDVGRWVTTGFRQSESAGIVAAQTTASKIATSWNSALSALKVPAFSFSKTTESVSSGTNPYAGMPVYYGGQGWQSSQGTTINYGDGCVVGGGGGSSITTSLPTGTNNDPVSCVLVNPGSTNSQNFNASLWCDPEFITWLDNSFQQDMANVQAGAISAGYLKGSQVALSRGAATTVSAATYSATGEVVAATPQPSAAVKTSILSDPSIVTEVAMRQVNAGNVQATTTRTTTGAVKDFGTTVTDTATNLQNHVTDIISNWQTQAATFNNNMGAYWGGIMSAFGISVSGGGGGGGSSGGYSVGGGSSGGISVSNPITPSFKSLVGSPVTIMQNVNMQNSSFTPNFTPRDVMNQVAADRNLALTKLGYR